jgi:hypothetical protein
MPEIRNEMEKYTNGETICELTALKDSQKIERNSSFIDNFDTTEKPRTFQKKNKKNLNYKIMMSALCVTGSIVSYLPTNTKHTTILVDGLLFYTLDHCVLLF